MSSYPDDQASIAKEICQYRALFRVLKKYHHQDNTRIYVCMEQGSWDELGGGGPCVPAM